MEKRDGRKVKDFSSTMRAASVDLAAKERPFKEGREGAKYTESEEGRLKKLQWGFFYTWIGSRRTSCCKKGKFRNRLE